MLDFILLMHDDTERTPPPEMWSRYFSALRDQGVFDGGSAVGGGEALRRNGEPAPVSHHIVGYIRVRAAGLEAARRLVNGNPVYECGGTVEVRSLPRS